MKSLACEADRMPIVPRTIDSLWNDRARRPLQYQRRDGHDLGVGKVLHRGSVPTAGDFGIIVEQLDDVATDLGHPTIHRDAEPGSLVQAKNPHFGKREGRPRDDRIARGVINNKNLLDASAMLFDAAQAKAKQIGAIVRRDQDGEARRHVVVPPGE